MKKTAKTAWLWIAALALAGMVAASAGMPIQIGLLGGNTQIFSPETEITGLRLNIPYSENDSMTGLDLGIVGGGGTIRGIRLNIVNSSSVLSSGLEIGLLNLDEAFRGAQFGIVNIVKGEMNGFQLGLVNRIGSLHGLQIGLINIIETGKVGMIPIISWNF